MECFYKKWNQEHSIWLFINQSLRDCSQVLVDECFKSIVVNHENTNDQTEGMVEWKYCNSRSFWLEVLYCQRKFCSDIAVCKNSALALARCTRSEDDDGWIFINHFCFIIRFVSSMDGIKTFLLESSKLAKEINLLLLEVLNKILLIICNEDSVYISFVDDSHYFVIC